MADDSAPPPGGAAAPRRTDGRWKRWSRGLHVFLSMFALLLLLFFAATGFVLHHSDAFELNETRKDAAHGAMPAALLAGPDREGIVAFLRQRHGVEGRLDAFEVDDREVHVVFRRPGYVADAFIRRDDGGLELKTERGSWLAALTEVHRGEHTGKWGGWLIDIASVGLALTSLSGLFLWFIHPAWRRTGYAALAAGLLIVAVLVSLLLVAGDMGL